MPTKTPTNIKLHRRSQILEVEFDSHVYQLSAEYLRVFSPSAEVKGHGEGQEVLQLNKSQVGITHIEPQGNYAVKLIFSDGHDSGIYTWSYLRSLGENFSSNWQEYLAKVADHNENKDVAAVKWVEPPQ
ncbi:gamma-butyrobetaine hydroxylase-like domain-containing protein [Agarilytica rhodophyticola]|uniref:gamma-butyrobetaine hydroxylase-like domain-containing protein n=1 Tax=Agarilytica rhodophyticola TaxID=1737490 RepID=UPI000B344B84|nr:DUF971 domain-containing protein [Agarilytica rhodophyticola]